MNENSLLTLKDWEKDAFNEFLVNQELRANHKAQHYTEILQCFCKQQDEAGLERDKVYELGDKKEKICGMYFEDYVKTRMLGLSITAVIIIFNVLLKKIIFRLVVKIGEDSLSQQLTTMTNYVFFAQFFNTGILLLLVNANMTEH